MNENDPPSRGIFEHLVKQGASRTDVSPFVGFMRTAAKSRMSTLSCCPNNFTLTCRASGFCPKHGKPTHHLGSTDPNEQNMHPSHHLSKMVELNTSTL